MLKITNLKNTNNLPRWELKDILSFAKAEMLKDEIEYKKVTLNNFQIENDENNIHFEVYTSKIYLEHDTTLEEFTNTIIENEQITKVYKTAKGLVQSAINSNDKTKKYEYNYITYLN